ncbi:sperm flagellar protein 2-like [Photinus pyralis]|uniref:sperm flagellar protein 2-like n=1 Tax=Photinus pyralis TaxID=7054 RepID=UPI001267257E|nr:sperm flagellar protein 2-like [Photinus pyralis]
MGDLIKAWIVERIGVVMNMDPQVFSTEVMDGTIIAQILLNYNIITETQAWQIVPTNNPVIASKNFKLIQLWLHSIGIQRATEELDEICTGKSMVAIKLFYELYLKLHDKNGLFFAMRKRQKERLHPTNTRFDVCTVNETVNGNLTEFVDNDLCQQLVVHQGVIKWNQDRYKALREKYRETRERYSKYLDKKCGLKEVNQFGNAEMVVPPSKPLERLDSSCSSDYDLTFDDLVKERQEASLKPVFEEDPKAAAEILKNIKRRKRREMHENEERVKQQKLLLMELWGKLLAQQEKELEECVSKKMLKQSTFEKQMTTKLFEVRQQAKHILANRRFMDDCALKKREDEFLEHVFLRDKGVGNQKGNYYVERGRMLELHRRLYAQRMCLYVSRRDDMCKRIVEDFVSLAVISAGYKEKYQADPDEAIRREWGNLFIKAKSLVAYLADVTELVVPEPVSSDLEEIYCFEMDRQEALDEREFESYMNFEKPWTDFLAQWEEHSPQIEHGMNVLSHNVNRVLKTKNPEAQSPHPLPAVDVAVCINGFPDCNVLPVLQKLLNKRKIRVIEMQDAVNTCLEAYKLERGTESLENALNDHTEAALAHFNRSGPVKLTVPVKGNKQSATSGLKLETKSTQTLVNYPLVDLSVMAEYGKLAYEALNVGDELTDNLLVVMLVEYIRSLNDLSGWALINYPNTLTQAAVLEQALTGGFVPDVSCDSGSIGDIADLIVKASEMGLKGRNVELQQSKLLPDLSSSHSLYRTYLTAFITVKSENCVGTDCSEPQTPLEEFYLEQGCHYELLYENLELNIIKRLAKMIIGEYSIPPKTSQELFGDTLNYVEANLSESAKFVGQEIKHQKETVPSEIFVASTGVPGDPSWQYFDIAFPEENYGEREERIFNMMLQILEDSIKNPPKKPQPVPVYVTERKEIKEVLCRLFRKELYMCEDDRCRRRIPQILDKLKVKIVWENKNGGKFEYESDEIGYDHTTGWFEQYILPEIIKKISGPIWVKTLQISPTYRLPKVVYVTKG